MSYKYRIIVAGSRDFDDWKTLMTNLTRIIKGFNCNREDVQIVSGGARGADKLGEEYAKKAGLALKVFNADWDNLGKRAGIIRNAEMAKYGTHLVAFWDGKSRGTKNMIEVASRRGLKVEVI